LQGGSMSEDKLVKSGDYFKSEQEMFEHLLSGGIMRPHFKADETNRRGWICLINGNRALLETGSSAENYLLGTGYWVSAGRLTDNLTVNKKEQVES